MANLMITTACNMRCPYCFGLDMIGSGHPRKYMTWEMFTDLLDWCAASPNRPPSLHLMGGEPTLHPRLLDMAKEIVGRGWDAVIFSNGAKYLSPECLDALIDLGVNFVVNVNHPEYYVSKKAIKVLNGHLARLGSSACLTINVFPEKDNYDFVWQYFDQHNLLPRLKVGVALPTISKQNQFMTKDIFSKAGAVVMEILDEAQSRGIEMFFECGVPLCVFDQAQQERLRDTNISHCGSRLDITPDGRVINCLPLSQMASPSFREFASWDQARTWYSGNLDKYRPLGVFDACMECEHRLDGRCFACLAFGMDSFSKVVFQSLDSLG